MAKNVKKNPADSFFTGVIDDFQKPEETTVKQEEKKPAETTPHKPSTKKPQSENEALLQKILAGDPETIGDITGYVERSTYYLTDLHRACIEVKAREDVTSKQDVVRSALESYFDKETVEKAKEELIRKKIKTLEKIINEENKK